MGARSRMAGGNVRRNQASLRRQVYERDAGRCGSCGLDTEALRIAFERACVAESANAVGWRKLDAVRAVRARLTAMGFEWARTFWECDHETAVFDHGAATAENCRTLCVPCHSAKTKIQAGIRANRPRKGVGYV